MTSTGQPKVPSACCSERLGAARIPRRAHVVARATPAGDGDTWGKPRDPIEDAKQFVYSSTERVRSRLTQSADDLGSKCVSFLFNAFCSCCRTSRNGAVQESNAACINRHLMCEVYLVPMFDLFAQLTGRNTVM